MNRAEEIMSELNSDELEQGYREICQWRKTSVLTEDSIVRKMHERFEREINDRFPLFGMEQVFLWEIAKLHYGER